MPLIDAENDQNHAEEVHHVAAGTVILHDAVAMYVNDEISNKLVGEGGPRNGSQDGDPLLDRDDGLHMHSGPIDNLVVDGMHPSSIGPDILTMYANDEISFKLVGEGGSRNGPQDLDPLLNCHDGLHQHMGQNESLNPQMSEDLTSFHHVEVATCCNDEPLQVHGASPALVAHNAQHLITLIRESGPVDGDPLSLKDVDEGESLDREGGLHLQPGREETFAESHGTSTAEALGPNSSDGLGCEMSLHRKSCVVQQPGGVSIEGSFGS
ncbi:hypothetical protein SESBI_22064 [Sesbania bispinosa]|nr:hypothetical protein SESBI_22064 [Sesbania bispinosa]